MGEYGGIETDQTKYYWVCAGLSKILLILGRLRRFLPGPKLDSVQIASPSLF
jgi:hypothetical protein